MESASIDVDDRVSYNGITHSASSSITETVSISIAPEEMAAIAAAASVAVKVEGSKHSVTYEGNDIAKQFLPNVASFYEQYVKSAAQK